MGKILDSYIEEIKNKKIIYDHKQEMIIKKLDNFYLNIKNQEKENIFFSDIFNFFKKEKKLGFYIWGDVGRGKTYLIDKFYINLDIKKKIRLHYHHFMKFLHNKLKENEGKKNPIKIIIDDLKKNYTIIFLDEFFVKDIADAMQLSNFFLYAFNLEIYFIITSNVNPIKLYEGGLQRQKFIKTIELLEKNLTIINIDGNTDYRYRHYEKKDIFFIPINLKNLKKMKQLFNSLSSIKIEKKTDIEILGRKINTLYISNTIVWFDFEKICGEGRSQLDYIEISSSFDTIFISNIKTITKDDIARRFIALIDEFYDRKINIVLCAEKQLEKIYEGEILIFDFKRTISRLNEMNTSNYLKDFDKNVF